MGVILLGSTAVSNWGTERQHWTTFYEQQLRQQVAQAIAYIRAAQEPHRLTTHFESFLILLRRARARPGLHALYIDLLTALHPWPLRWGKWDAWEEELAQSLPILSTFRRGAKQAEMLVYLAEIQYRTGRLETAVATSQSAQSLAWENQALVPWGAATSRAILALNRLGQNDEARRLLAQCQEQLDATPFATQEAERLEATGHLLLRQMVFMRYDGQAAAAAKKAQTLITALTKIPQTDRRLLATLYTDQATMLWASDQYEAAVTALEQAIALYTKIGDTYEAATTRGNLGIVYWSMARLDEAETAIRQSLVLAEAFNARWRMMNEIGNLCAISLSRGKLDQALHYTERHYQLALEADDAAEINRALGNRALALLYLGEYAAALPDLEESLRQLQELGLQQQLAETYGHLSCGFYGLGRWEEAATAVQQALTMAPQINAPVLDGMLLRCRAMLAPADEAAELLTQALALARRYRRRLDEGRCLLRLAVLAAGRQRDELWTEGAAILLEIGAAAWLDGRSPTNPPTLATIL